MQAPVRTILAATDLSRAAFAALRRAALIARAHGAALEVVHVVPAPPRSAAWDELRAAFSGVETDLRRSVAENLDAIVAQIESETGVRARTTMLDGKAFEQVAAHSDATGADVIVVGAHGENLTTPLLGTTAHRVLRLARTPVLLVKRTPAVDHAATPGYGHIVVATDFSSDSARAATTAQRLFPESSITLLHVFEAPFEAKLAARVPQTTLDAYRQRAFDEAHRELESFAASVGLSDAPRLVRHGSPSIRIREYASDTSADLIAVGTADVPRLQQALLGSVSLDVVTQAECDVLLARTAAS